MKQPSLPPSLLTSQARGCWVKQHGLGVVSGRTTNCYLGCVKRFDDLITVVVKFDWQVVGMVVRSDWQSVGVWWQWLGRIGRKGDVTLFLIGRHYDLWLAMALKPV